MRFDEIPLLLPNAERSNTRDRAQREADGDDLDAGKGSAKLFLDNVTAELSYPWPEPGRYGRNSNLRRLPELANETLLRIKVPSADSGIKFLRSVMNS